MTIARASTAVDTEKRYPAGTDTAKARAASGWREIVLALGVAGVLASCKPKPPPGPPPTPEVTAIIVKGIEVPNVIELPGRIEAVRTAEVRARVDGIVQRRLYQEGSDVRAGAQLFEIDPRDMRAALEAAEADLRRAEAARVNAAQVVSRYEPQPIVNRVVRFAKSSILCDAARGRKRTDQCRS